MAAPDLITYQDLVDHLLRHGAGGAQDAVSVGIYGAIQTAYRDLLYGRTWNYYYAQYEIPLVAPYSTGTVEFDYTGGAYERVLTLTTGTWPTWAAYGKVVIAGIIYDVEDRKSNSQITLTSNSNPGADVSSGTSYSLYRTTYTLPPDYRGSFSPVLESSQGQLKYITPDQWTQLEISNRTPGQTANWTLLGDPNLYASMAIVVHPATATAERMRFVYQRAPRQLRYHSYGAERTGTVTVSAGGTAVTGSSTLFTADHIGSVLRFGTTSDVPTGMAGLNIYKEQQTISAVGSATGLTLASAITNAYTSVKYTISDPIDVYPGAINALFRGIEYQFAIFNRLPNVDKAYSLYKEAKIAAYESDAQILEPRSAARVIANNPAWANPLGEDNT